MINVDELICLPAEERLELAEMLRSSVGYPADIENLPLPAWQRAHIARLLEVYASENDEGLVVYAKA
jgi:hypothetical protein